MKCIIPIAVFILLPIAFLQAQELKLMLPIGHTSDIYSVEFSPTGKKIVTASSDGTAKIWDANSGKLLLDLNEHNSDVSFATFSSDERKLLTCSANSTILWDINSGKILLSLTGHTKKVYAAKFSPDGQKIVSSSYDKTAKIWDANSGNLLYTLKGNSSHVGYSTFSPNSLKVVTALGDGIIKIWDVNNGDLLSTINAHDKAVTCVNYSPNGNKIATVSDNGIIKIWDANNNKLLLEFKGHTSTISSVSFSPDGIKIITSSYDKTAKIWDSNSGKLLIDLKGHSRFVRYAAFSPDGKKIATGSGDRTAKVWDANNGKPLIDLAGHTNASNSAAFSPDGKKLVSTSNEKATIWEVNTGRLLSSLAGRTCDINTTAFSPDGTKLVTSLYDGVFNESVRVWDLNTSKIILDWNGLSNSINSVSYSSDGKKIITASDDSTARIWDSSNGSLLNKIKENDNNINNASFSPDGQNILTIITGSLNLWDAKTMNKITNIDIFYGNYGHATVFSPDGKSILTASDNGSASVWDIITRKERLSLSSHSNNIELDAQRKIRRALDDAWTNTYSATFSSDGKKIVTASNDRTIKIRDAYNGSLLLDLKGHLNSVNSVSISPDNKTILSASNDYTNKLWNAKTGKLIYTFFTLDDLEYLGQLPNGYYQSSPTAAKLLHYVTKDLKVITFEQLDVKYNRPDKVLEALGNTDTLLINSYRKTYQKRIKKLGIDTTQFKDGYSVPESEFTNRDAIEYEQTNDKLILKIKGNDSTYKLDRFNVWVNEVPLFGLRGINISKKKRNSFDTTLTITLSEGENRIETSITNVNGTESYRMPLFVKYTPVVLKETKQHFIGIGINQFANPDYNLNWSVKDIRDLALKLKSKYPNIIIDTLFDKNVTKENILALKQELLQLNEDDKVIVSYSGHGVLSKDFDYYLSTYSINFNNPEEDGLAYDDLESLLDNIKPRQKLMFIDACHSGEVDKDEIAKIEASKKSLDSAGIAHKSTIKVVAKKKLGMANSFELMQSLFVNVGKGTGATIISAAGGMQYAQERGDLKNGVFTYSIIEAFNKGTTLKVSELKKLVGERVTQLTNGLQKPTSRNETNNYDWVVW